MSETRGPFITVSYANGASSVSGTPVFSAGHRLPRSDRPVDDGVFAEWRWHDDMLVVENDRYGFRPLFYSLTGGDLTVSPSIDSILATGAPAALDDRAIAAFLRLNYFVGEDTPFASIRAMPPGTLLTWRAGRVTIQDRRPATGSTFAGTREEAIEEFLSRFNAAIARRAPEHERIVLPLSGGRDSRHILFALNRLGIRPSTVITIRHYPPRRNDDERIAATLARAFDVPHVVLGPPPRRIAAERRKNALTEFCSDEHVQFLPMRDYFVDERAVTYDGIAGDTLTQSWPMPPTMAAAFEREDVNAAARQLIEYDAPGFEAALQALLTEEATRRFNRPLAVERVSEEVSRHLGRPNGANSFVFWNRTRREVALSPYGLLSFLPRVYAPFVDADVFDFMTSLPVALVVDRQFQSDALRRAYPDFADIPFETATSDVEDAAYARRVALELVATRPRSRFVRQRYVVPRVLAAAVKGRMAPLWFLPLIVWLEQIEAISEGRRLLEG